MKALLKAICKNLLTLIGKYFISIDKSACLKVFKNFHVKNATYNLLKLVLTGEYSFSLILLGTTSFEPDNF